MFDAKATDVNVTLGGLVDCSNDIQESGLAAARCTENSDELTFLHCNVNASKSRHTLNTEQVGLMHVDDFDDFLRGLIDLLIAFILVLLLSIVGFLGHLGLIEALVANHILKVLVSAGWVRQQLVVATHERFLSHFDF